MESGVKRKHAEVCHSGSVSIEFARIQIPPCWRGHFDMLHDRRRNRAYATAVQRLSQFLSRNETQKELLIADVGCGSGLLGSLLAKAVPKCKVLALETVDELSKIARETVLRNGLTEQVFVFHMHSSVMDSKYMETRMGRRADGMISELLDTNFIGEGLLSSVIHANECIIRPPESGPSIHIPANGRVLAQVYYGGDVALLRGIDRTTGLSMPESYRNCPGRACGSDLHLKSLQSMTSSKFVPISSVFPLFEFDFHALTSMPKEADTTMTVNVPLNTDEDLQLALTSNPARNPFENMAVALFWECDMLNNRVTTEDNETNAAVPLMLTTNPNLVPSPAPDHWRQSIFFINDRTCDSLALEHCCLQGNEVVLNRFCSLNIVASHDADTINIRVVGPNDGLASCESAVPVCSCGFHSVCSPFRFAELNVLLKNERKASIDKIASNAQSSIQQTGLVILGDSIVLPAFILSQVTAAEGQIIMAFTSKECYNCAAMLCNSIPLNSYDVHWICSPKEAEEDSLEDPYDMFLASVASKIEEALGGLSNVDIIGEPYYHQLQDEWELVHVIHHWRVCGDIIAKSSADKNFSSISPDDISLCCALLYNAPELHCYLTKPVHDVEGIDMSAINYLMEPLVIKGTVVIEVSSAVQSDASSRVRLNVDLSEVDSIRIAEWGMTPDNLGRPVPLGRLSHQQIHRVDELESHQVQLQENHWLVSSSVDFKWLASTAVDIVPAVGDNSVNECYGFAFWLDNVGSQVCDLSKPQGVKMFQAPITAHRNQKIEGVYVVTGITMDDVFVVGIGVVSLHAT